MPTSPSAEDLDVAALMEMRLRDPDTDPRNFLHLVNAIVIAHLEACCARSIRQGGALGARHPMVLDAAAWVSEVRDDDVLTIARRISGGLRAGIAKISGVVG